MPYDIDIIVISNIPKYLGDDVEVIVGLPSRNPWSLPFAHKKVFAARISNYDLFIYSEDDTLITKHNIEAFLRVTEVLPKNKIAGFLRYEVDQYGNKYCSTVHSHFHWDINSVEYIKGYTFAYFTNEHSACYILTRDQLQRAINSGAFLVDPHQGKYDLLCSAATDPYTQCGFKKLVCISHYDRFLLHHLPDIYIGKMGLELNEFELQVNALLKLGKSNFSQLFPTEKKLKTYRWNKYYYEPCRNDLLDLIPKRVEKVLSVGCGWGKTESKLVKRGIEVVGIPIDPIIAESTKLRGIKVIYNDLNSLFDVLNDERFDCIILSEILQHIKNPIYILSVCKNLLDKDGIIVGSVPNFKRLFMKRELKKSCYSRMDYKNFERTYLNYIKGRILFDWFKASELYVQKLMFSFDHHSAYQDIPFKFIKKYTAPKLLFVVSKK